MAHVPPLPGKPLYDENAGVDGLIEAVAKDPSLKLITTKTGLKSEPVHLFYKKNMFTAMQLWL